MNNFDRAVASLLSGLLSGMERLNSFPDRIIERESQRFWSLLMKFVAACFRRASIVRQKVRKEIGQEFEVTKTLRRHLQWILYASFGVCFAWGALLAYLPKWAFMLEAPAKFSVLMTFGTICIFQSVFEPSRALLLKMMCTLFRMPSPSSSSNPVRLKKSLATFSRAVYALSGIEGEKLELRAKITTRLPGFSAIQAPIRSQ